MTWRHEAPGLTADWLNGWLAALGVTVLLDGVRLSWADQPVPFALFETEDDVDLAKALAKALPTEQALASSTIARSLPGTAHDFARNVTLESFRERAALERRNHAAHVAASVSDLRTDARLDNLDHGAFDAAAPRGETLWSRASACAKSVDAADPRQRVRASLEGHGAREQLNGLGFDARRLPTGLHASGAISNVHADPVVELLCFAALALFPTRGDGRTVRQRGWRERSTRRGAFAWTAWRPFLDRWGIDALLDMTMAPDNPATIACFQVVPYQPGGQADTTRAYFAERRT